MAEAASSPAAMNDIPLPSFRGICNSFDVVKQARARILADRDIERACAPAFQCARLMQNSTASSSADFAVEAGKIASASQAIAP
jgi:hypothetical protein